MSVCLDSELAISLSELLLDDSSAPSSMKKANIRTVSV